MYAMPLKLVQGDQHETVDQKYSNLGVHQVPVLLLVNEEFSSSGLDVAPRAGTVRIMFPYFTMKKVLLSKHASENK